MLFHAATSNPFERLLPGAADGHDLEPAAAGPGMVIHPPMLYIGLCGLRRRVAFSIAALLSGRMDAAWARWSAALDHGGLCFLTCRHRTGQFLAYYELGWAAGGSGPGRKASFMPWLVGTALILSLAVTEKRGVQMWTALLAIIAFRCSLLGTFIGPRGAEFGANAFADRSGARYLHPHVSRRRHRWLSGTLRVAWPQGGNRGSFFENGVFARAMAAGQQRAAGGGRRGGAAGHDLPARSTRWGWASSRSARPYFNAVFVPLMAPALFLMAWARWTRCAPGGVIDLARKLRPGHSASAPSAPSSHPSHWATGTPMIGFACCWPLDRQHRRAHLVMRVRAAPGRCGGGSGQAAGSYYGMLRAPLRCGVVSSSRGPWSAATTPSPMCAWSPERPRPSAGTTFRMEILRQVRGPRTTFPMRPRSPSRATASPWPPFAGAARLQRQRFANDEVAIDRGFTATLYVRSGRTGEPDGLERASAPQALRQLDLDRLRADGAGRRAGRGSTGATVRVATQCPRRPPPVSPVRARRHVPQPRC